MSEDINGEVREQPQLKFVGTVTSESLFKYPYSGIFIPECMYARREMVTRVGGYDPQFKYWGFLDFFFKIVVSGAMVQVVPDKILVSYQTPMSDTVTGTGNERWKFEWALIQKRYVPLRWRLWQLWRLLRRLLWI
jgi:hypothetical protein